MHCKSVWDVRSTMDIAMGLLDECEKTSKRTLYNIRSVLLNQAKTFLQQMHDTSLQTLQQALDKETWEEVSIPRKYQKLVDKGFVTIMFGSTASAAAPTVDTSAPDYSAIDRLNALKAVWWDSADFESTVKAVTPPDEKTPTADGGENEDETKQVSSIDSNTYIIIDDEKFKVVNSVLVLFDLIATYVDCAILLEYVGGEAIHRLVQVFGVYNSRSCQLVLGAGAMHLVGLKAITAKHLALSSQCLGVVISMIPTMARSVQERLSSKHHRMLKEFDRVIKDYKDHRTEIFQKLVKIMEDLVTSYSTKFIKEVQTKYSLIPNRNRIPDKVPVDQEIHVTIKTLMKQCKQLYRVLSSFVTPSQRDDIFNQISHIFSSTFQKQLSTLGYSLAEDEKQVRNYISLHMKFISKQLSALHSIPDAAQKEFEQWFVFGIASAGD
jgi:vacuolar protein sorting-associated protein 54